MKQLASYDEHDQLLFIRLVHDKEQARAQIMSHALRYRIQYVKYNSKTYTILEVYRAWPIATAYAPLLRSGH